MRSSPPAWTDSDARRRRHTAHWAEGVACPARQSPAKRQPTAAATPVCTNCRRCVTAPLSKGLQSERRSSQSKHPASESLDHYRAVKISGSTSNTFAGRELALGRTRILSRIYRAKKLRSPAIPIIEHNSIAFESGARTYNTKDHTSAGRTPAAIFLYQ